MIYRVLKRLETGKRIIERGEVIPGTDLNEKTVRALEKVGALARVSAPPLAALPGWKIRAKKLEKAEIVDAAEFLEAPDEEISKHIKATPGQIAAWKAEITGWLTVPEPKRC